jgi:hypothetical protein
VDLNVEKQQRDARSILQHIKRLIGLRRLMPALVYGSVEMHALDDTRLYACVRRLGEETVVVLVNLSPDPCEVQLPAGVVVGEKKLLMSNMEQPAGLDAELLTRPLQAYETRLVRVEAKPISTLTARLQLAQPPVPPDESSLRDS